MRVAQMRQPLLRQDRTFISWDSSGQRKGYGFKGPESNKQTLKRILQNLDTGNSVTCLKCSEVWNRLTPTGICYNCDPVEQADRKKFYGESRA